MSMISRQKLIEAIKKESELHSGGLYEDEMLDIIESQPPTECVPLSEVYRVIAGHSDYHGDNILAALTCIVAGKEVKPVRPLPADQWIPCSERLPQEDGDYLVWYDCGGDETGYMVVNFDAEEGAFGCWHDAYDSYTLGYVDSEFIEMETAVAWKPVEPYKGVE